MGISSSSRNIKTRNVNWWGLGSAGALLAWFLCWVKNGPQNRKESLLFWGTFALIHFLGVKVAKQRFGLIHLIPLGVIWVVIILAHSGGIPPS